ncbi:MAG TPA: endonuclease MutS2 [bacterium]|nr:endonuclease MutS2 [bacterium]
MISAFQTLEFDRVREKLAECTSSEPGRERALLIKPFADETALAERMAQTTEMRDLLDYDQGLPIDGIHDLKPHIRSLRIGGSYLSPEELIPVLNTLGTVRRLRLYFAARREKVPHLERIAGRLEPREAIEKEIRRCIDENTLAVKDEASPELAAVRKLLARAQNHARQRMESMLRTLAGQGVLQENLITVRNGRLVLMVKEEYKRKVRGLVLDQSASGSSIFVEPIESVEDNNRIRELEADEAREVERILRHLADLLREALPLLEANLELLTQLDLLYAQGIFSRRLNAHPPELASEPLLHIAGGRHPLLVLRMGEKEVIPLEITLGEDYHTIIISGPNAGGKTVALKTVGLLTLMARCGLHIPALPHSRIGAISAVYASIGDQQSIDNDLSTFSSHLTGLKAIAETAGSGSLVLIDEIGAGTDPEEGSALAMAILEKLTASHALSLVTTHQSALKAFAYRTEGVENGSMAFDIETLQPTYHFRAGIPGSSYAFEIAGRMGLSAGLISRAQELVGAQKDRLEGLILELEGKIQHHTEMGRQADLREIEYRGLLKLYQERTDQLCREEKALKRKAAEEADEILRRTNSTVESAIREIREKQAQTEAIRTAKEALESRRREVGQVIEKTRAVEPPPPEESVEPGPIRVGDAVRWEKMSSVGEVVSEPDQQGRVLVRVEGVKIRAPLAELRKSSRKELRRRGGTRILLDEEAPVRNEVDLRGLRAEEAIERVELYLDEAIMAGYSEVRIIHGKGTGALRASIGRFLRDHPRVAGARLGNWNEGNTGVTVVELRLD